MSIKLRELIRQVRACKTAAEERAVIAKESALIRTAFKDKVDNGYRHRNVAKLLYIQMLGYPTQFGQLECLKLIAASKFAEKRIGYLGLMLLLDENVEILMLVTNSLKQDFANPNPYVVGLALCAMGNIASVDISRDLSSEVEKLFKNSNPYIRKKAALTTVRIIRKVPDIIENFVGSTINLLNDKVNSVILGGVTLIIEMIKLDSTTVKEFRKLVPVVVRILKNVVLAGYVAEYDVSGITDPFLQVKLIQLLRLLGTGSQEASAEMNDVLAQIAINTEHTKNPGNAILYETVQTIMSIEAENGLRVLGINILGRFLLNRDNNIRYVALNTLGKVVDVDTQAIQRHRNTIVDCLKDADVSIRRRALDLIYALVTKANVRSLTKELINYLTMATGDQEFKADLADKICLVVERYAPSKRWQIDTLFNVLSTAGAYTKEHVYTNLIALIGRTKSIYPYSVHKAYTTLKNTKNPDAPLIISAVWTIGEYGEYLITTAGAQKANIHDDGFTRVDESEVLHVFEELMRSLNASLVVKEYILNSLVKLSERFKSSKDRIKQLISKYQSSMAVELQQRSVEYAQLLSDRYGNARRGVLVQMPIPEVKKKDDEEKAEEEQSEPEDETGDEEEEEEAPAEENEEAEGNEADKPAPPPANKPASVVKKPQAKGIDTKPIAAPTTGLDLLDGLDFGNKPAAATSPAKKAPASGGLDILGDIFSSSAPAARPAQPVPVSPSPVINPLDVFMTPAQPAPQLVQPVDVSQLKFPPFIAFQKNGLTVTFNFKKSAPNKIQIMATFANTLPQDMVKFEFKVAVPKFINLKMKPPVGDVIPGNNAPNKVQRLMELENTQYGQKKLAVRAKIEYEVNGQAVSEMLQVDEFPEGIN